MSIWFWEGGGLHGGGGLISIETVKLASSQHRFNFDVHKKYVGNLDGVKLHWVGGKHLFFQWIWTGYVYFYMYISLWKIMLSCAKNIHLKSVFWYYMSYTQTSSGWNEVKIRTLEGDF